MVEVIEENITQKINCIMGVDINPGPKDPSNATYSVIVLRNNEIVFKSENVRLERLIRLTYEYKPDILAVDNPLELGGSKRELLKIASMLPYNTVIVQVNRESGNVKTLYEVARKHGVKIEGKPTPIRTAYALAVLASKGVGEPVVYREARTKIIIKRERKPHHGGSSTDRFKRRVRVSVLRLMREIKEKLDKNKLDYDLVYKRGEGGLEGAVFTVYAPRTKLLGIIKPRKGTSVSICIKQDYALTLNIGKEEREKPIIVGIDPGLSTGIAILDIRGTPIHVTSRRSIDRIDLIKEIKKYGTPVIIATDVTPPPEAIKKIASSFSASLYVPRENIKIEDKKSIMLQIQERYGVKVPDSHARDALAAAVMAFRSLQNKLLQVEKYVEKTGMQLSIENLKKMVIKGKSIAEAVEEEIKRIIVEKHAPIEKKAPTKQNEELIQTIQILNKKIEKLKKEKVLLEEKLRRAYTELKESEKELEYIKKKVFKQQEIIHDDEVRRLIENLKLEVKTLSLKLREAYTKINEIENSRVKLVNTITKLSLKEAIAIPKIPSLTKANLNKLSNHNINVLYVENLDCYSRDSIELLAKMNVYAILTRMNVESKGGVVKALGKRGIVVERLRDNDIILELDESLIVSKNLVDEVERRARELREELKSIEKERLLKLIMEYKELRKQEVIKELYE